MARVRLYLGTAKPLHDYVFSRPDGSVGTVEGLRLRAYVRFQDLVDTTSEEGRDAAYPECVVDTGSFLTIVPEKIWQYFLPGRRHPAPVPPQHAGPPPVAHHRRRDIRL